ncbi:23S rRNA (2-N-methyl-G2445)-methyltransferase [Desulfuromonas sp. DDH964]|uniref:bifunctional 23S rRNA (guanine(2069)-N(7))-methyltransferase RlmK/23S rRNA (guanine(2445)-N(2))-methyltransferase RlmL n=1 Tax=Desulfuromonas sp. DDH964 TaxID=1823759 RepID=UPI00078D8B2A|nr:bifunctional 23S rRNA (guanine(2069)-N(7))-methyltransferase RlmK/23S rRNA (guanine(2445)-N(2))-methyltransferase RlmL [Desulfuromonas sp. DDH964]AMV72879.1 23S rRNA (2-N-methyl-G2445)-methyltransferase [Desulfuromonas sp. DDH964]
MNHTFFFATAPAGLEQLLAVELAELGASEVRETHGGVAFAGPLAVSYRACLWSRLASRILLPLATFAAADPDALYAAARELPWEEHLAVDGSLAVDAVVNASAITHSRYAALRIKDAIVDRFRDATGARPAVNTVRPDLRINLYLFRDQATLALDLSGESLHRRGYRIEGAAAPLKENLAAALLLRAGWPAIAKGGGALVDPLCGSGTLLLEGALIAADIAPGLGRESFGFLRWPGHQPDAWSELLAEAAERREAGLVKLPPLYGFDADPAALRAAQANAERLGLAGQVNFRRGDLARLRNPAPGGPPGLVITNPPYGERLGEIAQLEGLYATLGERLRSEFAGWKAAIFTGNPELGRALGLRARRSHPFFNGPIKCQLLLCELFATAGTAAVPARELSPGAQMVANRLRKNLKNIGRWARREGISCYRLYDADLPEYAVAVDLYGDLVHVQEYAPPKTVDSHQARVRLREALAAVREVLAVPRERVFLKVRQQQKGSEQYRKLAASGEFHEVREGECRLFVNLRDYLDTGLFLDHRPTRQLLGELALGRDFLNLFAYTGSATVHAAKGGAATTTSVDLSRTYLDWARRNLELNGFKGAAHRLIQSDCREWLAREPGRYGLIFLDPPTFSNSKRMDGTFDVQRDHVDLLLVAASLLTDDGILIFSTNHRQFRLDREALDGLVVEELSRQTIPPDFARNPRIHQCWKIARH